MDYYITLKNVGSIDTNVAELLDPNIPIRVITYGGNAIKLRTRSGAFWVKVSIEPKISSRLPDDICTEKKLLILCNLSFFSSQICPKTMYLDIETAYGNSDGEDEDTIIAATTYMDGEFKYFSGLEPDIISGILSQDVDLVCGWNLVKFDWPRVVERANFYGIPVPKFIAMDYDYMLRVALGHELRSYKLEYACQELLGYGKVDLNGKKPSELADEALKEYNMQDVKLLVDLERKFQIMKTRLNIQLVTKCFLDDINYTSRFLDMVVCREALKRGLEIPPAKEPVKSDYPGAYVFAEPGIYSGVSMLDVTSLYPSIIIAYNIGPDSITDSGNDVFIAPNEVKFRKSPEAIYAAIERSFWNQRIEKKEAMKKAEGEEKEQLDIEQKALKACLNALYGLTGAPFFRFYNKDIAYAITSAGAELIKSVKSFLEANGYKVVLDDTDSVAVVAPHTVVDSVNKFLADKYKNYNWTFKMEHKFTADKMLVIKKKMYCYRGWDNIEYVGLSVVRSDISEFAKCLVEGLIHDILYSEGDYKEIIRKYRLKAEREIKKVPIKELGVPKGLKKDISAYSITNPWIEGLKLAESLFGVKYPPGSKPLMVYIEPVNGVSSISFTNESDIDWKRLKIDYKRMLEDTVLQKLYLIAEPFVSYREFMGMCNVSLDSFL